MNSSVLKDELYKKEIEKAVQGIQELSVNNPINWWDLFIIVVRGVTKNYTKQKAKIKNGLKMFVLSQIQNLETVHDDDLRPTQKERYLYYKEKYKEIIEKEIQGHQIRTRGYPTYELNEPDIHFYSKLEKRSAQRNTITELEDKTGKYKETTTS